MKTDDKKKLVLPLPEDEPKGHPELPAAVVEAAKIPVPTKLSLGSRYPKGVDRMCNCGHTLGAHYKADMACADAEVCGCEGFYPEGL